ncbi:BMC domain-containing protein [bacterium]|nr:BMC domain-containing protein [bacterium]
MPTIKSIGVLETDGFVGLIEGADAAVKAANVNVIEWRKIGHGYVSFVIEGEVAAVRSAIEAGRTAAASVGNLISEIVIPRPVDELKTTWKK